MYKDVSILDHACNSCRRYIFIVNLLRDPSGRCYLESILLKNWPIEIDLTMREWKDHTEQFYTIVTCRKAGLEFRHNFFSLFLFLKKTLHFLTNNTFID